MYSSSEICDRYLKRGSCILSLQIHKFCPVKVSYRTFLIEMPNFKQIPILSLQLRSFFHRMRSSFTWQMIWQVDQLLNENAGTVFARMGLTFMPMESDSKGIIYYVSLLLHKNIYQRTYPAGRALTSD